MSLYNNTFMEYYNYIFTDLAGKLTELINDKQINK